MLDTNTLLKTVSEMGTEILLLQEKVAKLEGEVRNYKHNERCISQVLDEADIHPMHIVNRVEELLKGAKEKSP